MKIFYSLVFSVFLLTIINGAVDAMRADTPQVKIKDLKVTSLCVGVYNAWVTPPSLPNPLKYYKREKAPAIGLKNSCNQDLLINSIRLATDQQREAAGSLDKALHEAPAMTFTQEGIFVLSPKHELCHASSLLTNASKAIKDFFEMDHSANSTQYYCSGILVPPDTYVSVQLPYKNYFSITGLLGENSTTVSGKILNPAEE